MTLYGPPPLILLTEPNHPDRQPLHRLLRQSNKHRGLTTLVALRIPLSREVW